MKMSKGQIGRRLLGLAVAGVALAAGGAAWAELGQPKPWEWTLQESATPVMDTITQFHTLLVWIITIITLFVLALLIWIAVRYNKRANPVPAKWSHNTPIEVIWTVLPVLILMFIAIFSFKLLFAYHDMPKPYMSIKATGYQWYWGYEYPDQKIGEFVSNILPEDEAKAKGVPFRLAATEPLVVPVNQVVRVYVTGADVIHAFAVPSFGIITDAVPGRVNETWFKVDRPGIYYGSCRELCGVDHAFMPIEVHAVSQAEFDAWVASKGGTKIGAAPPPAAPAPAATAVEGAAVPAAATAPAAAAPAPTAAAPAAATSKPAPAAAPAAK